MEKDLIAKAHRIFYENTAIEITVSIDKAIRGILALLSVPVEAKDSEIARLRKALEKVRDEAENFKQRHNTYENRLFIEIAQHALKEGE